MITVEIIFASRTAAKSSSLLMTVTLAKMNVSQGHVYVREKKDPLSTLSIDFARLLRTFIVATPLSTDFQLFTDLFLSFLSLTWPLFWIKWKENLKWSTESCRTATIFLPVKKSTSLYSSCLVRIRFFFTFKKVLQNLCNRELSTAKQFIRFKK